MAAGQQQQQQQPPSGSGQGVNDISHGSISGNSGHSGNGNAGGIGNGNSESSDHSKAGASGGNGNTGNSDSSGHGSSDGSSGNGNSANGNGSSSNGSSSNGNSGGARGNGNSENSGNAPAAAPERACNGNSPQCPGGGNPGGGNSGGGNPGGGKPTGGPPRGDDPRPRDWDKENNRGETAFDDRKSPRTVGFLGRSANVRIYPNYSDPSVYLQLRFGKIQELDVAGRPVPGHMVPSLAEAANVTFAAGNTTVNGVNMSYVNVSLDPLGHEGFTLACKARGGEDDDGGAALESLKPASRPAAVGRPHSRSLMMMEDVAPAPMPPPSYAYSAPPPVYGGGGGTGGAKRPQLTISLLFGFDDAVTLPYGDVNITVPRNGLKWSVSVRDWPFCNVSNTLLVSLELLVANNASAQVASDAANAGTQQLRIVLGSAYNATLGFLNYALDGAAAASGGTTTTANATRMPVNVTLLGQGEQGVTTVAMGLPNPEAYGVSSRSVWYDPTQTTTSIYLAVNDPGNALVTYRTVAVQNSGNVTTDSTAVGGSGTGAATALRTTLWTILAAVLLGMFMGRHQMRP
ncbi:hypothetical protein PLESTF_001730100 [Pleodorina starrii]|nr:hypothetical protein PLESTM_000843100 [Pleodorina starrii]GLC76062.1 hypothetical protein PLESTF_001730100 [Pleodorina starrii]